MKYSVNLGSDKPEMQAMEASLNNVFGRIGVDIKTRGMKKAKLPFDGSITTAIVLDDSTGVSLAFFDGATWRRSHDRTAVT